MANGTIKGSTGTIGNKCLKTSYIDVAYMGDNNEAVETSE